VRNPQLVDGITVNAIAGTHVVLLGLDLSEERREGCLGFAIQREDHSEDERAWLQGMKTFEATDPGLGPGGQASTHEHPIQGFQWADYSAKPGHDYTYTVVPMYGSPKNLHEGKRVSVPIATEEELGGTHSVFFNRGSVATQEYARRFQNRKPDELSGEMRAAAYKWLQRGLLDAMLAFIARAKDDSFGIFGAVYEFQWPEALEALRAASDRGAAVKVVYDAIDPKPKKGKPQKEGSTHKKNRAAIAFAGVEDLTIKRTSGTLMHNKFLVLTKDKRPISVWTGSTNWTENGIFGHMNCGHITEDEDVAAEYLEYWKELGTNPDDAVEQDFLGKLNPRPPKAGDEEPPITTVFSPHHGNKVLDWYRDIAAGAEDALFMTFAFGMDGRFQKLYEFGASDVLRMALMEQEGTGKALEQAKVDIARIRKLPNVVIAIGNRILTNSFDRWLAEMSGLTSNVEWVHTKFMLVDPLSDAPIVITGSANFSKNSTSVNNENMLVIRGDKRVADIYLGEYMRLYTHYGFRESVARTQDQEWSAGDWTPSHLKPNPSWQEGYFDDQDDRSLRRQYFAHGKLDPA
jgi:phosphatidylserine/phosphatidylglycerophosphate/cardiolipin synthase-like enzyme